MSELIGNALARPFEDGTLAMPRRAFLIRADVSPAFDANWRAALVCEQTFKPAHERLRAAGFDVVQRLDGRYEAGLCLLTKHKAENQANVARAWGLIEPGGLLVCAGARSDGAASMEAQAEAAFGLAGKQAKYHCRVFWSEVRASAPPPGAWRKLDQFQPTDCGAYLTPAGAFSFQKIDPGSRLLAEHFPEGIAGAVADLGAGWGYLSCELLARFAQVTRVDLYEAEQRALDAARVNIAARPDPSRAQFFWHDVTAGLPAGRAYDWIVTNPPFHDGKLADIELGRAFIAAAAKSLRRGGSLLMVANQHLPYEAALQRAFKAVHTIGPLRGFKIFHARA